MPKVTLWFAEEKDCALVLSFIKEPAKYEEMLDEAVAAEDILREWIFKKEKADANR